MEIKIHIGLLCASSQYLQEEMLQLKLDFCQKPVNLLKIPDLYFFISVYLDGGIILGRCGELQLRLSTCTVY